MIAMPNIYNLPYKLNALFYVPGANFGFYQKFTVEVEWFTEPLYSLNTKQWPPSSAGEPPAPPSKPASATTRKWLVQSKQPDILPMTWDHEAAVTPRHILGNRIPVQRQLLETLQRKLSNLRGPADPRIYGAAHYCKYNAGLSGSIIPPYADQKKAYINAMLNLLLHSTLLGRT
jgi:hypothetical protein